MPFCSQFFHGSRMSTAWNIDPLGEISKLSLLPNFDGMSFSGFIHPSLSFINYLLSIAWGGLIFLLRVSLLLLFLPDQCPPPVSSSSGVEFCSSPKAYFNYYRFIKPPLITPIYSDGSFNTYSNLYLSYDIDHTSPCITCKVTFYIIFPTKPSTPWLDVSYLPFFSFFPIFYCEK